jgi:hypothetical protein
MRARITARAGLKAVLTLGLCCLSLGCGSGGRPQGEVEPEDTPSNKTASPPTTLTIRWQRLVDGSGSTCDRCGKTGDNVEEAYQLLKQSLAPLGFQVELKKVALNPGVFQKNPLESNRIWIGGDALEELLGAKVGQSRCCSACGDSECRTIKVDGHTHEAITTALIVKAGLRAAARKLPGTSCACAPACCGDKAPKTTEGKAQTPCCEPTTPSPKK